MCNNNEILPLSNLALLISDCRYKFVKITWLVVHVAGWLAGCFSTVAGDCNSTQDSRIVDSATFVIIMSKCLQQFQGRSDATTIMAQAMVMVHLSLSGQQQNSSCLLKHAMQLGNLLISFKN